MNTRHRNLSGWQRLALMPVLLLAVLMLVLAGSFAFRGTAHAQSGSTATGTLTIASSAKLIARTTLQVSVTYSCTIPDGAIVEDSFGSVTVSQASGRQIAYASDDLFLTNCDGTAHTFQLFLTPSTAPFHGGPAIASGNFNLDYLDNMGNFGFVSASFGPQTINISG